MKVRTSSTITKSPLSLIRHQLQGAKKGPHLPINATKLPKFRLESTFFAKKAIMASIWYFNTSINVLFTDFSKCQSQWYELSDGAEIDRMCVAFGNHGLSSGDLQMFAQDAKIVFSRSFRRKSSSSRSRVQSLARLASIGRRSFWQRGSSISSNGSLCTEMVYGGKFRCKFYRYYYKLSNMHFYMYYVWNTWVTTKFTKWIDLVTL